MGVPKAIPLVVSSEARKRNTRLIRVKYSVRDVEIFLVKKLWLSYLQG